MNDLARFLTDELDYARVRLMTTLEGITDAQALWQPAPENPSIAGILLHAARIDDLHVSRAILQREQIWDTDGWQQRLGLAGPTQFPIELGWTIDTPGGHDDKLTLAGVVAYAQATRAATKRYLETASAEDLTAEVDDGLDRHKGWTAAKHIAHCALHECHHQGQIDYVKGLNAALARA